MKNRILAFLLATVMLFTFAMPVSAQEIINITDYGEDSADSATPAQPYAPPQDDWDSPEPEQDAAPPDSEPAPALGQSGADMEDEADLIAQMDAWLNSLRLAGSPMGRAASGDTGTITHSTISIKPYDVTVPGVGRAYGSVIWRMKIKGDDAFCLQIWKLAGGTCTAGDATSGNGSTAQYIANFMASGKSMPNMSRHKCLFGNHFTAI